MTIRSITADTVTHDRPFQPIGNAGQTVLGVALENPLGQTDRRGVGPSFPALWAAMK